MKLVFQGWHRKVDTHNHTVTPVKSTGTEYELQSAGPLEWAEPMKAYGQIKDVKLGGSFLVEFEFDEKELRSWLKQCVCHNPEAAVRLLSVMQGEVILALHRRPHIAEPK